MEPADVEPADEEPADEEPTSGPTVLVLLPECDEADVPVEAAALADAAALFVALADEAADLADPDELAEAAGDTRACAEAEGVQVGLEDAAAPVPPDPAELVVVLVLGLAVGVPVAVEVPLRLGLGLTLTLGLPVPLGEDVTVGLAVLPLPVDDVAGAVVDLAGVPAELAALCVAGGFVDDEAQGLDVFWTAAPDPVAPLLSPCVTVGAGVPWPSVAPVLLEELLPVMAELRASVAFTSAWRAGGTADRTTPTANTATPTAKAGRSIASRQFLGRCRSRRCGVSRCRRPSRRASAATAPEMASQTPRAPAGRLA